MGEGAVGVYKYICYVRRRRRLSYSRMVGNGGEEYKTHIPSLPS